MMIGTTRGVGEGATETGTSIVTIFEGPVTRPMTIPPTNVAPSATETSKALLSLMAAGAYMLASL
jgi:hypothetical protein